MSVVGSVVGTALAIALGALGWSLSSDARRHTEQRRFDREFERIVRQLDGTR